MINIESIILEWEKDVVLDPMLLDKASLNIPKLHAKYLKYLMQARHETIMLKKRVDELYHELHLYYSGKAPAEVYRERPFHDKLATREGIERYIRSNERYQKAYDKISLNTSTIEALEYILKQIFQLTYIIKGAIEWQKWQAGS
jgi:hypothetical protein